MQNPIQIFNNIFSEKHSLLQRPKPHSHTEPAFLRGTHKKPVLLSEHQFQSLVHIAHADMAAARESGIPQMPPQPLQHLFRNPIPVIHHIDIIVLSPFLSPQPDIPSAPLSRKPVLNGILYQGLQGQLQNALAL